MVQLTDEGYLDLLFIYFISLDPRGSSAKRRSPQSLLFDSPLPGRPRPLDSRCRIEGASASASASVGAVCPMLYLLAGLLLCQRREQMTDLEIE